jgi:hypothetical protein
MSNTDFMEQNIKYIDGNKILVRTVRGKADFEEIYGSWKELIKEGYFNPPVIGIINDFCGAQLNVNASDIKHIKVLLEEDPQIFKDIRIAVVVDSFKNIVFPMIIEKVSKQANVRPFSAFQAAYDWINGTIE